MRFSWWTRVFGRGRRAALESARAPIPFEQTLDGFPPPASLRAQALSRALGMSVTLASWLDQRGHLEPEATRRFLNPRLAELTAPDAMLDRKAAAQRIARAVQGGERIVVFGDYDCDGMTSAAIFTEAAESSKPAPSDMMAAMARSASGVMSPRSAPTSTPDAAAKPQKKAHRTSTTPPRMSSREIRDRASPAQSHRDRTPI